jgi:isopentenyl-diphosphate Delta-isomerase
LELSEEEFVVLVDEQGNERGTMEKLLAHRDGGTLHRAFSVFLFHPDGRMLLQRRAWEKYHFGGRWTNACCSHPRLGETPLAAANRRLREELGIEAELTELFSFVYQADDPDSGLSEHELDHVFVGTFDGEVCPNPDEVADVAYVSVAALERDIDDYPERYTPWFRIALERVREARRPGR